MKKILLLLLAIVAGFLGYIGLQPPTYLVYREVTINAPPEIIFPLINNAKLMNTWNPWMEIDPDVKITFSGPEEGVGAKTSWTGGKNLGTGSATVSEVVPNISVKTKLEYVEPHTMTQVAEISLKPSGSQTLVRWSVSGENVFIGRIFCFFMNMDKMIGDTFEKGLGKLKNITEKSANIH